MKSIKWRIKIARPLVVILAASQCITSFAGAWVGHSPTQWSYQQDDGTYQSGGWFLAEETGKWYYLDANGIMVYGWIQLPDGWYFLNTVHDGTFGAALSGGWYWMDGYCYYLGADGKLYTDTTTPDGFLVNQSGQWVENGTPVYVAGKGIPAKAGIGDDTTAAPTARASSVSRGSGGGGGGGGGGSSSAKTYYDYSVMFVDEYGAVLGLIEGEARKNSFITIPVKEFEGYTYSSGQSGRRQVTSNQSVFVLHYVKNVMEQEEIPAQEEIPEQEENTAVPAKQYSYTIIYKDVDSGTKLGSIESSGTEGAVIKVPVRHFEGYAVEDNQTMKFTLDADKKIITVRYTRDLIDEDATASEANEKLYSYTIKYTDKDTMDLLLQEKGSAVKGTEILPDQEFEGYEYASGYEFTVRENGDVFIVYLIRTEAEEAAEAEAKKVPYTVICVDEDGKQIKVIEGTVTVREEPIVIYPDYPISGYERTGDNECSVSPEGNNTFILEYRATNSETTFGYTVQCIDIDTMQEIADVKLEGAAGEEIEIAGICPDGYEVVGTPPETVKISANEANNYLKIYYRKIPEDTDIQKEAAFTVQYRAYQDHDTVVLNDLTGTWAVGEKIPIYFLEELTGSDGRQWKAVGESPRIFTIRDQAMNTFLIEYRHVGDEVQPDTEQIYSIRYIAQDTGSILGVTTGIAQVGDMIPYRNTFHDYGFADSEISYTVTEDDENVVEVMMKRVNFPGHEVNPSTGLYDGFEWISLFVDSNGEQLLTNVSGFTVTGDELYIDYPDVIEKEGVTYRAANPSPFKMTADKTTYQQFIIQYETGDPSETKLEDWKRRAQQKKDEFYGTTPFSYYIAYMEKNSWNDIGLKFGVANKGSEIEIECETIDGWIMPQEALGSFTLDQNGYRAAAQYERLNGGTSADDIKRSYSIHFIDPEQKDLFEPYNGQLAFAKGDSTSLFTVYYPNSFYDDEGNRWEADERSPQTFTMSAMDENQQYIGYHQVYENKKEQFIVESNSDVNRILSEFATHTFDSQRHEFYVIGRDYSPAGAEVSDTILTNNLAGYTNEIVDTFVLNGTTYTVALIGYYKKWDQSTCSHEWTYTEELEGNCLTAATRIVRCETCGKEVTTIVPAVGHVDHNHDSICDHCGIRLKQNLGDEITVSWNSGSIGAGTMDFNFVCIDTDYLGTGKMLYLSADDIGSEIYGPYTEADGADYDSSAVKYFLDDRFADGLSVSNSLQSIEGSAVSMLTKEEYDRYRSISINNFPFPSGTFLTKGEDMESVLLTDGTAVSKDDANRYPIRPIILMDRSEEDEGIRTGIWKEGDMQAREIGGKLYLFRCVDANYTDQSNTDKSLALFLCDDVIPASEGLGFDEDDQTQSTRFFGDTNNYKYSTINQWLTDHKSDTGNLVTANIGILNEYTGATEAGRYQNLSMRSLSRFTRDKAQVMYSNLFIPSVEEAVAIKEYLWKFNGSESNNASEVINNYCEAYWLRTPQYGTDDMVYTVNLKTGVIEPKSVKETEGNRVSNTGIRPMYIVEQAY